MTQREARALVLHAVRTQLREAIAGNADWPEQNWKGAALPSEDANRVRAQMCALERKLTTQIRRLAPEHA